jgi:hypothetical protein
MSTINTNLIVPVVLYKISGHLYSARLPDIYKKYASQLLTVTDYPENTRVYGENIDAILRFDNDIKPGDQLGDIKPVKMCQTFVSGAKLNGTFISLDELQNHFELIKANTTSEFKPDPEFSLFAAFADGGDFSDLGQCINHNADLQVFKSYWVLTNCKIVYSDSTTLVKFVARIAQD